MNKWQKIVGIVSLAILAIINFVIYGLSDMQTIYKGHPSVERVLSDSHDALLNIGYLVLANYLIIVFLFICLWRKGTNKSNPSPIKIISVEKITLPFAFLLITMGHPDVWDVLGLSIIALLNITLCIIKGYKLITK